MKEGKGVPPMLAWLRYLLVLAPVVVTPLMSPITNQPVYMFEALCLLLLVRARELVVPERAQWAAVVAEALGIFLYTNENGGVLYLLFTSTLVSLFAKQDQPFRLQLAVILWVSMNIVVYRLESNAYWTANLVFLLELLLLFRNSRLESAQGELRALYDELKKKHYELDEARKQIIEYAKKVEDSAQAEERNRIAREIHDDLGHKLIRLKMILEAVLHIMPSQHDRAMNMVAEVRDQLTDSMETMRQTVRRLKPDDSILHSYSLDRLMEDLSSDSAIKTGIYYHGHPYPVYPSCEITLFRNAQEAITNAIRHGEATEISIDVYYEPKELIMIVSNNGKLPDGPGRKGLGVSGMEERTRILGGSIAVEAGERYNVITRIPLLRNSNENLFIE